MAVADLIAFNLVLVAAMISPGAAMLFLIKTSMTDGRAAGMATGLGLGLAASLWTLAALLGLEGLFVLFPWAYGALKIAGAIYLFWIAIMTWRHAKSSLAPSARPRRRAAFAGLAVNASNPKAMLFAAAVIVVIFPQGLGAPQIALITLNHLGLELAFNTSLALLLTRPQARAGYLRAKPLLDRIAASLLGAFGLRLLLER